MCDLWVILPQAVETPNAGGTHNVGLYHPLVARTEQRFMSLFPLMYRASNRGSFCSDTEVPKFSSLKITQTKGPNILGKTQMALDNTDTPGGLSHPARAHKESEISF